MDAELEQINLVTDEMELVNNDSHGHPEKLTHKNVHTDTDFRKRTHKKNNGVSLGEAQGGSCGSCSIDDSPHENMGIH